MNQFVKAILALTLILTFAMISTAQTPSSTAPSPAPAKKAASSKTNFKKLIAAYYAAWSMLNTDAPAKFYAKDANLVFYDIAPMKYNGWSEYREGVQKHFFDTATSAKLTPNMNDLKVTVHGDVAWTTVTFHLSVTPKSGSAMELDARHTAIWERRNGRWLIVHEHVSAPLPG